VDAILQLEQAGCNLLIGVRKKKDFGFLSGAVTVKTLCLSPKKGGYSSLMQGHKEHKVHKGNAWI